MLHIAYYISGHGYGHAVRSIEVIKALARKSPFYFFHIKTTAPEWFFPLNLDCNYTYYRHYNDVGTVQHHFHEVDKIATLDALRKFFDDRRSFIEREIQFFNKYHIQLVIGDIPPLAFAAAYEAGIPAVAIGNFSWDWIYRSYLDEHPEFEPLIKEIQEYYRMADVLLRLPMHGPMPAFRAVEDTALIARKARRKARDVRRMLRLPDDGRPVVLVALRPADLERVQFERVMKQSPFKFIVLGQKQYAEHALNLPQDLMPFPELVNAADVVVSKPGYGIVSECIANRTPLVYTERKDFPEYRILVDALQQHAVSQFIPSDAFFAGKWQAAIEAAVQSPWDKSEIPLNGAEQVGQFIQSFLSQFAPMSAMSR